MALLPGFEAVAIAASWAFRLGLLALVSSYSLEAVRWLRRARDVAPDREPPLDPGALPFVTLQLPVADEPQVVARLIEGCCAIDYPRDRFEIQVLDDSAGETTAIVEREVRRQRGRGFAIVHLRRPDTSGYKGGNLANGLLTAGGEYFAVFDADCVPDRDFLHRTLPAFRDPQVGIVQAGTRRFNRDRSLLTRAQDPIGPGDPARPLRSQGARVVNEFSGSAGVIRRACLVGAGGWQADTLAEDHDLSIRAWLAGWRCVRLEAALATDQALERVADFKRRVARCNTGPAQCYRKHLLPVLRHPLLAAGAKAALLPNLLCPWLSLPSVALVSLASCVLVLAGGHAPIPPAASALPSGLALLTVAAVAASRHRRALAATVLVYVGTSFVGMWGAARGLAGLPSGFHRSPKRAPGDGASRGEDPPPLTPATLLEGGLALTFLAAAAAGTLAGAWGFVPLHLLCAASCGVVFGLGLREARPC